MSGIGGLVAWRGEPVSKRTMERMMGVVRHRGPDGVDAEVDGAAGFGHALLALRAVELRQPSQPLWLPDRSAAVVADCRLDNRSDLTRALGDVPWFRDQPSDGELILAAYERWQTDLVQHLLGDFAFAVWDATQRRVIAARDPFGVRPLFYRWTPRRFALASEPKQILALAGVSASPDDLIVGEFLFGKFEDLDRTFFEQVRRVPPAHLLVATAAGVEISRYWNPDPGAWETLPAPTDHFERFRELLTESVRARLESDYPCCADLSGGLDSSSIVVVAADVAASLAISPPLTALAGVFPGLSCDESPFIRAVETRVPFDIRTFEPARRPLMAGLDDEIALVDSPFVDLQRGSWMCEAEILRSTSSRTLLTGLGGDELLHEEYYLRDLALRGRFVTLTREAYLASRYSWHSFGWLAADAFKPLVPEWARALRRRLGRRRRWHAPRWARPDFVRFFESCPQVPAAANPGFPSLVQTWAFRWLNFPGLCWALESSDLLAASAGVSVSHPFLDRRLAEYVLSIPFDARLPGGQWKVLIRRGLSSRLPAIVRDRTRKTSFSSLHLDILHRNREALTRRLFDDGQWSSKRYVDRDAARHELAELTCSDDSEVGRVDGGWRLATLELWSRYLGSRLLPSFSAETG